MQIVENKKRVRFSKSARKNRKVELITTPARVRVATRDDLFAIMDLARIVHKENGLFNFNDQKVAEALWPQLTQTNGIIGVIGPKEKLEGLVILRIANYWYSDNQFLEEMCVFVHPDYRNATESRVQKLIEFAKKVATDLELPLMIGVLSNTRTSAKVALYTRNFGEPAGAFFLWGAKTGSDTEDLD